MFKKILCPLDLSERSFKALATAAELANLCHAELVLLHMVEVFMSEKEMVMLMISAEHYKDVQRGLALSAKEKIKEALDDLGIPEVKTEIVFREGSPRKDLNTVAEKLGADLIVISKAGGGFITDMIIGSTAEALVRHAKIPVLVFQVDQ